MGVLRPRPCLRSKDSRPTPRPEAARRADGRECDDAVHGRRALPRQRHGPGLSAPARRRPVPAGRARICRQLGRGQLFPLLPIDALRRSETHPGLDSRVARLRRDIRNRPGRHERRGAGGRRASSRTGWQTARSSPLREVDNVTLWVHPWAAAPAGGRIREEIEANVSFALSEQRAGLRALAQRVPRHSRQGGGACAGAQVRPE